ncbi:MAG: hypothetical protein LBH00_09055 [Planctomycetaceae bacterium]|nr:hypothetical protein [Planctomycetaceae bacterium]
MRKFIAECFAAFVTAGKQPFFSSDAAVRGRAGFRQRRFCILCHRRRNNLPQFMR